MQAVTAGGAGLDTAVARSRHVHTLVSQAPGSACSMWLPPCDLLQGHLPCSLHSCIPDRQHRHVSTPPIEHMVTGFPHVCLLHLAQKHGQQSSSFSFKYLSSHTHGFHATPLPLMWRPLCILHHLTQCMIFKFTFKQLCCIPVVSILSSLTKCGQVSCCATCGIACTGVGPDLLLPGGIMWQCQQSQWQQGSWHIVPREGGQGRQEVQAQDV